MSLVSDLKAQMKRYAIIGGCLLLALVGWHYWYKHAKKVDQNTSSTVLQPDQKSKIIVDPINHTITTVTKNPDGTTKTDTKYLPDAPTSVTEGKDGKITVQSRTWGPEKRPYLGVGYDGVGRAHVGLDFLYWKRLDLGTGLSINMTRPKDTTLNLNLSYNFWSNTSLALSYDNHRQIGCFLKVRF
jgi:hypothetical protein